MHGIATVGQPLTKHPKGSLREFWAVAYPLILTAASGSLMLFADRAILSHYSLDAMNMAVTASMPWITLQVSTVAIAAIAEVFVGRYNGAGKIKHLGWPVWQMVYFSLLTTLLFWSISMGLAEYLLPSAYRVKGSSYLKISLYFGPLFPLIAALSCFFIGRGRIWMVTLATLWANLLNIGLDYLLIFGWSDKIPSLGANGAAWATGISAVVECVFLWCFFLSPHNRREFNTADARFRPGLFWECLRLGVPSALGYLIEIIGWSAVLYLLAECSPLHATVFNISYALWILFSFLLEGLGKATVALVANAIGAKDWDGIPSIYSSSIYLILIIFGSLLIFSCLFPELLVSFFLGEEINEEWVSLVIVALRLVVLGLFADALAWASSGVLTAAGDTRFVMLTRIWTTWFLAVLPIYYFVMVKGGGPLLANALCVAYGIMNAAVYMIRYMRGTWKKAMLVY